MSATSGTRLRPGTGGGQVAYAGHAGSYDRATAAYQGFRRAIVDALPVGPGEVVLDVGCGTGLCFGLLLARVGPRGHVIGIEESPEMVLLARERVAHSGWPNVTVVRSRAEDAEIAVTADAALFCAVHDVLQSPEALRNIVAHLRPRSWVAAGGGKWAAPWLVGVNAQIMLLHAPYVRSFDGFGRPWGHLERLIQDVHVRELALGSGYVLTGRTPARSLPGGPTSTL
jgi:SAM-dependent methyltransferase